MPAADSLVALFEAMTQNIQQDRADLNRLDHADGDAGDNMAENFQLVTATLRQVIKQSGPDTDVGAALLQASGALRKQGRGATAAIYAQGLGDAAERLKGRNGFTIDDLLPLLEGLLSGTRQASGLQPGQGSLLDVLLPGVLTYVQAKQASDTDLEAILKALLNLRRGANSTAAASRGYGRDSGKDTTGKIDPGAAGAASLLEGLFGALLKGALQPGKRTSSRKKPPETPDLGDLLGQLTGQQGRLYPGGRKRKSTRAK